MKAKIYTFMVIVTEDDKTGAVLMDSRVRHTTDCKLDHVTWNEIKDSNIGDTVQRGFDSISANAPVIETGMTLDEYVRGI